MPERMCVGCRGRGAQGDLVRVVATSTGYHLDRARSAPGRGAYLHPDPACLARAIRTRALGRALRAPGHATDAFADEFLAAVASGPA